MVRRDQDRITFRDDLDGLEDDESVVEDPQRRLLKTIRMLGITGMGAVFIVILLVFFQPEGVVMTETWPNGYPKTRATYVSASDEDGRVLHGPYRAWYEDGQISEEGRYVNGKREGTWSFWTPSGEADTARTGGYSSGLHTGSGAY